jgi:hypothetical protein
MSTNGIANIIHDGFHGHINQITSGKPVEEQATMKTFAQDIRAELLNNNLYFMDLLEVRDYIESVQQFTSSVNVITNTMEVGILLNQDHHGGSVRYNYRTKNNQTQYINADSFEMEPLCFPLLFPYGERGWGNDLKVKNIQLFPYLASRLLRPEPTLFDTFEMPINRFQLMSRLSQYWLLEGVSRAVDKSLLYQKMNQKTFYGGNREDADSDDEDHDDDDDDRNRSKKSFLSDSITGFIINVTFIVK